MSAHPISVLIVEDSPADAEILQRLLSTLDANLHFTVTWAETAEQAFDNVHRHHYDLLLLDYLLPGADGLSVLARIQQLPLLRQPSVIMLTGIGREDIAVQAMKNGARDYLSKDTLDTASLLRAITSVLQRKHLEDQLARSTAELHDRNAQLQADLHLAREIQLSFLPQQYPCFPPAAAPAASAIRFCHRYQPTGAVGGDFFDILPLTDLTAGVFICDVMGHGVRAALVTAVVRGLLEELRSAGADPGHFLTQLNRALLSVLKRSPCPLFASALYLVLDIQHAEIRYANAGHPSPFLLPAAATAPIAHLCDPGLKPGPALGVFDDTPYTTQRRPLAAGDRLLLYTDGLYEVPGPIQELYGELRLLEAITVRRAQPTPQLCDGLLADIRRFAGQQEFLDDICLVGVDTQGVGGPRSAPTKTP